jgi:hypothetical protein
MTARIFKRIGRVRIARSTVDDFVRTTETVRIDDLRFAFSVDRDLKEQPNQATLTLYNASPDTRAFLQQKPLHVAIDAGYDADLATLFRGDLTWCSAPRREDADVVIELQLGDGDRAYNHARISKSFAAGADPRAVLRDVASSMGITLPRSLDDARELGSRLATGITLAGPSREEMTRILKARGFSWSIQDGQLQVLRAADVRPGEAILVSQDTGMIGSPGYGAPDKASRTPTLTVRKTLDARLVPGCQIKVVAADVRGLFKVIKVAHRGDTHEGDWSTEVQAVPL